MAHNNVLDYIVVCVITVFQMFSFTLEKKMQNITENIATKIS
jgi:hypothetical protein